MSSNGETVNDISDKLDIIMDAIEELKERQEEIIEKLTNLSLPGGSFDFSDFDS